jgi:hypothetical protein
LDRPNPVPFCEWRHFGVELDPAVSVAPGDGGGGVLYACDSAGQLYTVDHMTGLATPTCIMPLPGTEIEYNNITNRAIVQDTDGAFQHQEFDINSCAPQGPPLFNGAAFAGLEYVGNTLYGTGHLFGGGPSDLHIIDPATGITTLIGPTGLGPISGLVHDPGTGTMYGVTGGGAMSILVTINLVNGAATPVGPTGVTSLGGLAFGPDGNLYGIGNRVEGGNFYRINPGTGVATFVGPTGFPSGFTGLTLVGTGEFIPPSVQAYWTKIHKVAQIPVPFQWWIVGPEGEMIDVLAFSETYDQGPVYIFREWAVSDFPIPLEELQYDTTPVQWNFGDDFEMFPGEVRTLPIPIGPETAATLVRYTVTRLEPPLKGGVQPVTRFVTEAVLEPGRQFITSVLVNFDLHNDLPGTAFDNFELDFFGDWLDPDMVVWWYDDDEAEPPIIPAWGVDPLVRPFPPDYFPGMPPGIEVTWIDKFDPFEFCEMHHFGLEFDPAVQGPGGGILYACDAGGMLYTVDHTTGMAFPTCPLPLPPTEIEFNPLTNRAILQEVDGGFQHQEFDINTCAPLGPPFWNGAAFNGLEFVGNTLYGTGQYGCTISELHIIDPNTGITVLIGPTGVGPISGLTWDPSNATMYGVVGGQGCTPPFPPDLVWIDINTGVATRIGPTGASLGGLAFGPDGQLYGIGSNRDGGNFYRINTGTGAATLVGPTGHPGFTGLTLAGEFMLPSVQAYWTEIDTCQVPIPWQFWRPLNNGNILDIIELSETWWPPEPVQIVRQFVVRPDQTPLQDLTWDGTAGYEWRPADGDTIVLFPGSQTVLEIPMNRLAQSALVRYTVQPLGANDITTRVINEALVDITVDVPDVDPDLRGTRFEQNLPNPFSEWTVLTYSLEEPSDVTISIYDVSGRRVSVLREGEKPAGQHAVRWDASIKGGKRLPAGVYFAVMEINGKKYERKMILTE